MGRRGGCDKRGLQQDACITPNPHATLILHSLLPQLGIERVGWVSSVQHTVLTAVLIGKWKLSHYSSSTVHHTHP